MSVELLDEAVNLVTIHDILDVVPVSDRSIRTWVRQGLLPRPVKVGLGRAIGTVSYYPAETLNRAKLIYRVRSAAKKANLMVLVKKIGTSKLYLGFDENGLLTLSYVPKSFQEEIDE